MYWHVCWPNTPGFIVVDTEYRQYVAADYLKLACLDRKISLSVVLCLRMRLTFVLKQYILLFLHGYNAPSGHQEGK